MTNRLIMRRLVTLFIFTYSAVTFASGQNEISNDLYSRIKSNGSVQSRVTFIATGQADKNPLFTPTIIREVRAQLKSGFSIQDKQFVTLFGKGPNSKDNDTEIEKLYGLYSTKIRSEGIISDAAFTINNLTSVFAANRQLEVKNSMYIIVGHGKRKGIETSEARENKPSTPMPVSTITTISSNEGVLSKINPGFNTNVVFVSGACYGGVYATAGSCGFFGARPNVIAAGCWSDSAARTSDYSSGFVAAITAPNLKDKITFEEAHWRAVVNGYKDDVPYTSVDALADKWFDEHKETVVKSISVLNLKKLLSSYATPSETSAFYSLTAKLGDNYIIKTDYLKNPQTYWGTITEEILNTKALNKLFNARDLLLTQFSRRIIFESRFQNAQAGSEYDQYVKARNCEMQNVSDFFKGN